jgi:hypothetical protein
MRAGFVLTTIVLAVALGVIAAASESRLLTRAVVVGFVPALWAVSHLLEWLTGRDMWSFTAPYPYRWMREEGETATPRPGVVREPVDEPLETDDDRSTLPVAA